MRRVIAVLLVGGALLGTIGWRVWQKQARAAEDKRASAAIRNAPTSVETVTAERRDLAKRILLPASIESPIATEIAAKLAGRILTLPVRAGDRVTRGQVLVQLDPSEVQAEVLQKEAVAAQARSRLAEAAVTQDAQGVGLTSAIRRQRAALETARAQSRQARADVEAQIAAAEASVADVDGRIAAAEAQIAEADARIASADASVRNAATELARQEALIREGATAQQLVDNARTALDVQKAALGQAQQQRRAALAARDSARAQRDVAQRQVEIVRNKARADVDAAAATVSQAQAGVAEARANTAQGSAYVRNLAALRAAVSAADADVRAARVRLAATTLRAPFDGVVTLRVTDVGALASPGQTLVGVQSLQPVWATVSVPEELTRRLGVGQEAKVTLDALPGETRTGQIVQILPAADPQSRQLTARIRLDNPGDRLRPGMSAEVTLVTERAVGALVVPREALKTDPEKPGTASVTIVADGKAAVRTVKTGLDDGAFVAIDGPVQPGDAVIVLTTRSIKDGQPVRTGTKSGASGGKGRP